ncbi:unnamed protein product [Bursaphelenchus okinawaensis]|uniref:Uncharacterized protein n=1 Tax=Bursaphelenchus okinawaensis TaxID=465554 RepID=A0A811KFG8_9BILA|nr:unnamed protein product [Bursaphelenchus okinawaensis]CAG9102074.1 unnamed protein product [Bursaphelenchus okinawaensis]
MLSMLNMLETSSQLSEVSLSIPNPHKDAYPSFDGLGNLNWHAKGQNGREFTLHEEFERKYSNFCSQRLASLIMGNSSRVNSKRMSNALMDDSPKNVSEAICLCLSSFTPSPLLKVNQTKSEEELLKEIVNYNDEQSKFLPSRQGLKRVNLPHLHDVFEKTQRFCTSNLLPIVDPKRAEKWSPVIEEEKAPEPEPEVLGKRKRGRKPKVQEKEFVGNTDVEEIVPLVSSRGRIRKRISSDSLDYNPGKYESSKIKEKKPRKPYTRKVPLNNKVTQAVTVDTTDSAQNIEENGAPASKKIKLSSINESMTSPSTLSHDSGFASASSPDSYEMAKS